MAETPHDAEWLEYDDDVRPVTETPTNEEREEALRLLHHAISAAMIGEGGQQLAHRALDKLSERLQAAEGERDDLRVEADTFRDTAKWHADKRRAAEQRVAELERRIEELENERDDLIGEIGGTLSPPAVAHSEEKGRE